LVVVVIQLLLRSVTHYGISYSYVTVDYGCRYVCCCGYVYVVVTTLILRWLFWLIGHVYVYVYTHTHTFTHVSFYDLHSPFVGCCYVLRLRLHVCYPRCVCYVYVVCYGYVPVYVYVCYIRCWVTFTLFGYVYVYGYARLRFDTFTHFRLVCVCRLLHGFYGLHTRTFVTVYTFTFGCDLRWFTFVYVVYVCCWLRLRSRITFGLHWLHIYVCYVPGWTGWWRSTFYRLDYVTDSRLRSHGYGWFGYVGYGWLHVVHLHTHTHTVVPVTLDTLVTFDFGYTRFAVTFVYTFTFAAPFTFVTVCVYARLRTRFTVTFTVGCYVATCGYVYPTLERFVTLLFTRCRLIRSRCYVYVPVTFGYVYGYVVTFTLWIRLHTLRLHIPRLRLHAHYPTFTIPVPHVTPTLRCYFTICLFTLVTVVTFGYGYIPVVAVYVTLRCCGWFTFTFDFTLRVYVVVGCWLVSCTFILRFTLRLRLHVYVTVDLFPVTLRLRLPVTFTLFGGRWLTLLRLRSTHTFTDTFGYV